MSLSRLTEFTQKIFSRPFDSKKFKISKFPTERNGFPTERDQFPTEPLIVRNLKFRNFQPSATDFQPSATDFQPSL